MSQVDEMGTPIRRMRLGNTIGIILLASAGCSQQASINPKTTAMDRVPVGIQEELSAMLQDFRAGEIERSCLIENGDFQAVVHVVRSYRGGDYGFIRTSFPVSDAHLYCWSKFHVYSINEDDCLLVVLDEPYKLRLKSVSNLPTAK